MPQDTFNARGHPNIRSSHGTTLMTTRDRHLTTRGYCIVAVEAEKGLSDLGDELRDTIRREGSKVRFTLQVGGESFTVEGWGDPRLNLAHPSDMVIRKSGYICDRTLMIHADKAASDIDKRVVELLRKDKSRILISIQAFL